MHGTHILPIQFFELLGENRQSVNIQSEIMERRKGRKNSQAMAGKPLD